MARISTELNNLHFVPGEELRGGVHWDGNGPSNGAELRLFYYTEGRGTRDAIVVDELKISGDQTFSFHLPEGPYSFSGELISLMWALELVADSAEHSARLEFVLSPTGQEVNLHRYPVPEEMQDKKSWKKPR